jgi:hypothetical protein
MFAPSSRSSSDSLPLSSPRYPHFSGNSGVITEHEGITPVSNTRTYFANSGRRDQPQSFTNAYPNTHYLGGGHDPTNTVFSQSYNADGTNSPHDLYPKPIDNPIVASHTRRAEVPLMIDTYNIGVGYSQSSPLTSAAPPSDLPKSAGYWSGVEKEVSPQPSRSRKPRREKPRIDLAPDQPPTTQGKPRERVYVACLQWYASAIFFPCVSLTRPFPQSDSKNSMRRCKTCMSQLRPANYRQQRL